MAALISMVLASLLAFSLEIKSVAGGMLRPLEPAGPANVLVFMATDCPVSNGYAPEIQRLCAKYGAQGVRCLFMYEDPGIGVEAVRAHVREYGYGAIDAAIDADGAVARRVGATITPEVAVVDRAGAVRYRGRIDNQYASLGRPRRVVTVHDLADAIDAVLSGRAVAAPLTQAIGCFIVPAEQRRKNP